jgi:hypothetical protein
MEEALNSREPWLRELNLGVHPALAQPIFALQQVWEDVPKYAGGLSDVQIWASPLGLTPAGFHLRHLAGSTDRLTTYLLEQQLSEVQLAELRQEKSSGPSREELLAAIDVAIRKADVAIRRLAPDDFGAPRFIGRKRIRTTAIGLAMHIGEHAQRHTGQIISACHLATIASTIVSQSA